MGAARTAASLVALIVMAACGPIVRPTKTKLVEVPVETQVALDPKLTAQEPHPARPPNRCVDAKGRPTICNRDAADWLNAYAAALDRINARMREILGLQPKGPK